jgi:hypothetical protein
VLPSPPPPPPLHLVLNEILVTLKNMDKKTVLRDEKIDMIIKKIFEKN